MAEQKNGNFIISYGGLAEEPIVLEKSGLVIGRLASCDIVLNQSSVSRVHAGINYLDEKYVITNLSSSNALTLNGRRLDPRDSDVLANGDIIQIGPYTMDVELEDGHLRLNVRRQLKGEYRLSAPKAGGDSPVAEEARADVLQVFWEKRTREKENPGSRLRPVGKPEPGKAVIKWKPTADLRPPWRKGLFIWIFLIFAAFAVLAFWRYPQTFASKPLASPHIQKIDVSLIANRANENSCTTCHSLTRPVETACITCHQAEQFHASNTRAHEAAGITCTVCHKEHQGENFQMSEAAQKTCAQCHNDDNKETYNGLAVRTAHGGSFGYPASGDGNWTWKGLHTEIAETVPAINAARAGSETEQVALSRQFHVAHVSRLEAPAGMTAVKGRVSCSTCHTSLQPVDRVTPRQTCAGCHNNGAENAGVIAVNCVSCHVQHPFSTSRWDAFLSPEARAARKTAVATQIQRLNEK